MSESSVWDGFARAIVRLELPSGSALLAPRPAGDVGPFSFERPVHIITAYNPAGIESDEQANLIRHRSLAEAVSGATTIPTIGSAPDGSMPEPGFGVLDMALDDALGLARDFGQLAIYRWAADALDIVDVDGVPRRRLGWSLSEPRPG